MWQQAQGWARKRLHTVTFCCLLPHAATCCYVAGGEEALYVFSKEESSKVAQDEIARLMALPVEHIEEEDEEEEEEEDDRPLWQRRLDAEADDGDGRSSNIP